MASTTDMNIHQRMLKILDMVGALQRTKQAYGYKYVPEEEIQAKVTAGMLKYGVMLYPTIVPGTISITPFSYEKYDKNAKGMVTKTEHICSAEMKYLWVNTDKPEDKIELDWAMVGMQEDPAMAFGAALTYTNRYALLKTFQIATSENDPDNYRSKQRETMEQEEKEILTNAVQEVVDAGSKLIAAGVKKEDVWKVISDNNNGEKNAKKIQSVEVCQKIMQSFATLTESKTKKTTKTKEEN